MKKIIVFMSTYNGKMYLKEQIESILKQKEVEVFLSIRDDGSGPDTKKILDQYKNYSNVFVEYCENIGAANSFMELLYREKNTADYYAFADQDDIWKERKLARAVELLEKEDKGVPLLYCSNQTVISNDGKTSYVRYSQIPKIDLINTINGNKVSGCTMVFNEKLKSALTEKSSRPSKQLMSDRMHDVWVVCAANCIGKVIYDKQSYMYYRQHENNVVGVKKRKRLERMFSTLRSWHNGRICYRSFTAKELLRCFETRLVEGAREILELYIRTDHVKGRIRLCFCSEMISKIDANKVIFRVKVLLGLI